MNDNRGIIILGKREDCEFHWFDELVKRDAFDIGDIIYMNGCAYWVMAHPYERNGRRFVDVSNQYMEVEVEKFDADWAEYLEVDDTHQDFLAGTR